MSTTANDLGVMRSIILISGFRGSDFDRVCAALLLIGLHSNHTFTAAELPKEVTQGDIHISGLATKALIKMGLLEKVGYCPSPNPDAKGRPVCLLSIPNHKRTTARTFLERKGYVSGVEEQASLAI